MRGPEASTVIRVVVATAPGAPLGAATIAALEADPRCDIVAVIEGKVTPERMRALAPDVLLSAAHRHMLDPYVRKFARQAVGLHPSLLPAYRGSWPLWWALRNREHEVGLTLYHLADEVDAGPIIAQARVSVEPDDTFASLYDRVAQQTAGLLVSLHDIPAGTPQGNALVYRTPSRPMRIVYGTWWRVRPSLPFVLLPVLGVSLLLGLVSMPSLIDGRSPATFVGLLGAAISWVTLMRLTARRDRSRQRSIPGR